MMTTAIEQDYRTVRHTEDRYSPPPSPRPGGNGTSQNGRARGLGWFSIGLGLAEVAMPRRVARLIGVQDDDTHRNILFAYGLREIATGLAILTRERTPGPVWARVGGDVLDLAFLGRAMTDDESNRGRVAAAAAAVLGVTALDLLTSQQLSRGAGSDTEGARPRPGKGVTVREAITVASPPDEVYHFWRDFGNLPRFMEHLEAVQVIDDRHSRWRARAPAGTTVEWDAEIVEDRPYELISWRSVERAEVPNQGTVRFRPAPGGRGTEIHVVLQYDPPGGRFGALAARLFGEDPAQQVKSDLRRLKQVLETGEVVQSDASVHRGPHPAQPSGTPATWEDKRRKPTAGWARSGSRCGTCPSPRSSTRGMPSSGSPRRPSADRTCISTTD
jgi:uncharacterized membrane protein